MATNIILALSQYDSSSESDSDEEADTNSDNTEPEASSPSPLPASTKVETPQDQLAAGRPLGISSSDEESALSLVGPSPKRIKAEIVLISSSSSEPEEEVAVGEVAAKTRRGAYALKMAELPAEMRRFLPASRSFHTRLHSLERNMPAVAPSTYDKAEERLLCKYFGHLNCCLSIFRQLCLSGQPMFFSLSVFLPFQVSSVTRKTKHQGCN